MLCKITAFVDTEEFEVVLGLQLGLQVGFDQGFERRVLRIVRV